MPPLHPNISSLKASIRKMWADYPEDQVRRDCSSFCRRFEAVIAAKDEHIE